MSILKIARMGHPVLSRRADEIPDPTAPEIRKLAADMIETMADAPGVGLAAPQVHVPIRLVVFRPPTPPKEEDALLTILINPVLEALGEDMGEDWEGCLSVPGLRGLVPRHNRLRYHGTDLNGNLIERTVEGFHARVVQHECDHLDGFLYPQRMNELSNLIFDSEMHHVFTAERSQEEADEQI